MCFLAYTDATYPNQWVVCVASGNDIVIHNIPHVEQSNLTVGGLVINVTHVFGPMKNHPLIQVSFGEET